MSDERKVGQNFDADKADSIFDKLKTLKEKSSLSERASLTISKT